MVFKIPYTFIPGTKAKANEVNSNFSSVADFLTELNTNLITTTNDLSSTKSNLTDTQKLFQERRTKYCVNNSDNTLITTSGTTIYFNSPFEITDHKGTTAKIQTLPSINCQSLTNGNYNIFVGVDSTNEYFINTIYKQKTEPTTKNLNDIWLNTSKEPLFAGKWDGTTWVEYAKVPVGSFTMNSNSINSTSIFPFNQNGYQINTNTTLNSNNNLINSITNIMTPDWAKAVSKNFNTVYQADTDGYLYMCGSTPVAGYTYCYIGSTSSPGTLVIGDQKNGTSNTGTFVGMNYIPKGYYYKFTGSYSPTMSFIPVKGAN